MITTPPNGDSEKTMTNKQKWWTLVAVATLFLLHSGIFYRIITSEVSKVQDYDISNCNFIQQPEKIMVCFDFKQNGKDIGAYATTSKTIFLRTTNTSVIRHEALHYLLYRDTNLTEEQQHKLINDLEIMEDSIYDVTHQK